MNGCTNKNTTPTAISVAEALCVAMPPSSRARVPGNSGEQEVLLNVMFATSRAYPFYSQGNRGTDRSRGAVLELEASHCGSRVPTHNPRPVHTLPQMLDIPPHWGGGFHVKQNPPSDWRKQTFSI